MSEFFDWLFNSEELDNIFGLTLIFGIGALLYFANWWCLLYDNIPKLNPEGKFVSMVPPLGGLLIAIGILLIGGGWWALVGLTDPFIGSLVWALAAGRFGEPKKTDKDDKNDNGD